MMARHDHRHGGGAGRRTGHAPASGNEVSAEGNAAGRPQAGRAVRFRRADVGRRSAHRVHHRAGQGVDREPLRHQRRARAGAAGERQGGSALGSGLRTGAGPVLLHAPAPRARVGACGARRARVRERSAVHRRARRLDHRHQWRQRCRPAPRSRRTARQR